MGLIDKVLHQIRILESLAPEWLPLKVAEAHYGACDALNLRTQKMEEIGKDVGTRIQGTFLGTVVRSARAVGLTPWLVLSRFGRLWSRLIQGGGVSLHQLAPKDARVEIFELPLARYSYFRTAFCGVIDSGITIGAGRAVTVKVAGTLNYEERLVFNAMWV